MNLYHGSNMAVVKSDLNFSRLNGKQVIQLFNQYKILDFIVRCYGALHTTGPE